MNNDPQLESFSNDFLRVKKLGFRPSHRANSTGIGKTYEDLLGVAENNLKEPDLHGFEVKSQRAYTGSYVTIFTKSPTMPKGANAILRNNYGSFDEKYPDLKVLHTSIFADKFNTHKSGYRFTLSIDNYERKIYLIVADKDEKTIDNSTYWTFDALEQAIVAKITRLAYVSAETRRNAMGQEEFWFNKAHIFSGLKPFHTFLELLMEGVIMFDIRIGAYKTGPNRGRHHDHGSGFRIKKQDMKRLYKNHLTI
ncbi:MvaI/BcnI family restriction endonuclease [Vibrio splendidus]|uniref:MvaI/BcnI restriction endonuclease domain-containing protein n=1 Tax=Vibrio splendidus TaxID=29497 RepID=A0A2N7K187_VIBSP|nr:MvaI/BcnI family restriction endonuclease [Vibrio splendidus]PMM66930.1 hypothetical protein BCT54_00365 [Vibrio splendidus]